MINDPLKEINFSHHAYLLSGTFVDLRDDLISHIESTLDVRMQGNPDVSIREMDVLTIGEARELASAQSKKTLAGGKQLFVISFVQATREAQNALLKVLEEPTDDTFFILITPATDTLLPTLLSRLHIVAIASEVSQSKEAKQFLAATPAERLTQVAPLIESKDRGATLALLNQLESTLHANHAINDVHQSLSEILTMKDYIADQSSSLKLILEHLAVTIPISK